MSYLYLIYVIKILRALTCEAKNASVEIHPNVSRMCLQQFRERLSEKVRATIPNGIVGCFEFTVLQRNLREWQERLWIYVCEC